MSLRVWLPLNGDLRNQGLDDSLTFSTIGTLTFNNNGKIGKCYQRATTDTPSTNGININSNLLNLLGTEASVAMWVKPLGTHTHYNGTLLSSGNWNTKRWAFGVSQDNTKVDVLCGMYNTYIDCNVPVNEWTHLCSIFNNGVSQLYKNGVYIGKKTNMIGFDSDASNTCIGRETYANGYFGFNGLINDVRIYDHALSPREVKEISRGLILHYPLNRAGFGQDNLLLNTNFNIQYNQTSGWDTTKNGTKLASSWGGYNAGVSNASTVYHAHLKQLDGEYVYEYIRTTDETWLGIAQSGLQSKLIAGEKYVFSWEQYCVEGNNYSTGGLYYYTTGATSANFHLGLFNGSYNRQIGKWQKFVYTFTAPQNGDYSKYMQWYIYGHAGGIGKIYIRRPKLEKGEISTPWTPNPADPEYTALGLNDGTIYDCSGYQYNGINNNVIYKNEYIIKSPKYNSCACFNGTNSYIYKDSNTPEAKSASFWVKFNNLDNQVVFADYKSHLAFGIYSNYLVLSCNETNTIYRKTVLKSVLTIDKFYFITIVRADDGILLYINGKLQDYHSITDHWPGGMTDKFTIGCRSNYTTLLNGNLSDFRIYATALSAEDVKELYNVSASVDRKNNFYTYEYNEIDQGNQIEYLYNLTKTYPGTFYQDEDGLHLNNKIWLTHDYISINPSGKTYKYEITYSADSGNMFDIGWERYDAQKTARDNNACIYVRASTEAASYKTIRGTVDLSTDGVNPCAFIKLRILNKWTNSIDGNAGTATIHSLSLKEYPLSTNLVPLNITKTGVANATEIIEKKIDNVSVNRSQELNCNNFYEY